MKGGGDVTLGMSKASAAERRTWSRQKHGAQRKNNGKQDQQNLENRGPG